MRLLMCLLLIGTAVGQNPAPKTDTTKPHAAPSPAVLLCRLELNALEDTKFEDFQGFPTSRVKEIRETLETCLRDSYAALTKYQLASAGVMLEWTERTIYQRYIDDEGAERQDGNLAKDTQRSPTTGTATAKVPDRVP